MMSELRGAKAKTMLTADEKRMIARRKVETGHSKDMVAVCMVQTEDRQSDPSITCWKIRPGWLP